MRYGWAAILVSCLLLTGCPTDMKRFTTGEEGKTDPVTSRENFNISFAFRDTTDPTNRVVQVQGNYLLSSASMEPICGASGDSCTCDFYTSTSDTSPVTSTTVSLSPTTNVLSCTIPGAVAASSYTFVRVHTTDEEMNSGFVNISTSLTAENILGDLDTKEVRKVFDYSCTRTFFEGSGVSGGSVNCGTTPDLGLLQADYKFYLFQGVDTSIQDNNNLADHPTQPTPLTYCNRTDTVISCGLQSGTPVFGLLKDPVGIFKTTVFLTSKPDGGSSLFGYAALADSDGLCPPGLLAVRAWKANPPSITKNSLGSNPPSSFLNLNGSLDSVIVQAASSTPSDFQVSRSPNADPSGASNPNSPNCDTDNSDCSGAQFAGFSLAVSASYSPQVPIICTLSPTVVTGL